MVKPILVFSSIVLVSASAVMAQDADRRERAAASGKATSRATSSATSVERNFKPLSDALGTTVRLDSKREDALKDVLIVKNSGDCVAAILESGYVVPVGQLSWNATDDCYELNGSGHVEASGERDSAAREASESRDSGRREASARGDSRSSNRGIDLSGSECILASSLNGLTIMGRSGDASNTEPVDLGSVGDCYMDCGEQRIVFLTTSVGGVLGIGADSKVIPFRVVDIERSKDGEVCAMSNLTEKRLESAPTQNDEDRTVNNPGWRGSLYTFYGCDTPDWDDSSTEENRSPVKLQSVLDSTVVMANDEQDVEDLMIDPSTHSVVSVSLANGTVRPMSSFEWQRDRDRLATRLGDNSEQETAEKEDEAASSRTRLIKASVLADSNLYSQGEEFGSIENIFIDPKNGKLTYLTMLVGDTLGLGGSVKVIPWGATDVQAIEDGYRLNLRLTKAQLEKAPNADGELGSNLYDPKFRERVDALASTNGESRNK